MKVKYKNINFIIDAVIYPFDVMVSINQTYDEFAKNVLKKWKDININDFKKVEPISWQGRVAIFTDFDTRCVLIKIEDFDNDVKGYATLVHEISHATEFILRKCGIILNENSHEAYAYLTGYFTYKILQKLLYPKSKQKL